MTPIGGISLIVHLLINLVFWLAGLFGRLNSVVYTKLVKVKKISQDSVI